MLKIVIKILVGFAFDSGSPSPIMVDEGAMVNLTVALLGNTMICGEVEIYFRVSENSSSTLTQDYTIVTVSPLILSTEHPNDTISININDDGDLFEPDEFFEIFLYFKEEIMIDRVKLNPRTANITIRGIICSLTIVLRVHGEYSIKDNRVYRYINLLKFANYYYAFSFRTSRTRDDCT